MLVGIGRLGFTVVVALFIALQKKFVTGCFVVRRLIMIITAVITGGFLEGRARICSRSYLTG